MRGATSATEFQLLPMAELSRPERRRFGMSRYRLSQYGSMLHCPCALLLYGRASLRFCVRFDAMLWPMSLISTEQPGGSVVLSIELLELDWFELFVLP